jgi:riboflavin kinase/FMN adenylyltransferase
MFSGKPVSSTRIRAALASCRLGEANAMLGRPFAVCGEVIRGAGRGGAVLGVPTANLDLPPGLAVPAPSVYATSARICGGGKDEPWRKSVTSFCKNPTFGGNALTMETHILDFSADIYGKPLEVRFIAQMRTEKRFSGIGELAAQLQADIRQRRAMDWS